VTIYIAYDAGDDMIRLLGPEGLLPPAGDRNARATHMHMLNT
jgi:hypothetical protein